MEIIRNKLQHPMVREIGATEYRIALDTIPKHLLSDNTFGYIFTPDVESWLYDEYDMQPMIYQTHIFFDTEDQAIAFKMRWS